MKTEQFHTYLREEAEKSETVRKAQEHLDSLTAQHDSLRDGLSLLERLVPFMGNETKIKLVKLEHEIADAHNTCEKVKADLDAYFRIVQSAAHDWIEENSHPSFDRSREVYSFYGNARRRLEKFRECVKAFLRSLGEARGAMSANYDQSTHTYSKYAGERMKEAVAVGRDIDKAIEDIAVLQQQFTRKAKGTVYASIELPAFGRAQYQNAVQKAVKEPIGKAHMEFERILKECEQLRDEGIDRAHSALQEAENNHANLTEEHLTRIWREEQETYLKKAGIVPRGVT